LIFASFRKREAHLHKEGLNLLQGKLFTLRFIYFPFPYFAVAPGRSRLQGTSISPLVGEETTASEANFVMVSLKFSITSVELNYFGFVDLNALCVHFLSTCW